MQAGKAEALYRNPADLFVARLFSEINEIPLNVEGGALRTPIGVFAVPGLDEGDAAILCIRRRAIRLGPAGQGLPGAFCTPGPKATWRSWRLPPRASSAPYYVGTRMGGTGARRGVDRRRSGERARLPRRWAPRG